MNKRNKRITSYFILFSLLIVVGVAFAILQANLQINGTAIITQNTWNVHFDNMVVNQDSVPIGTGDTAATIDPNNDCKVDFEVTLSLPGDFYEFTVDVVNDGTIDAMIGSLTKTLKVDGVVVDSVPEYLNYTVTYEDGSEILSNHLLSKNTQETYKVRVEYKKDIDELPNASTITTSIEPVFLQADDTAIKKKPYNPCTYDGELVQGAEYINGQYTYRYMQDYGGWENGTYVWQNIDNDGWGVHLSDPSSTEPVTTKLCTSINDKPIVSMYSMFYNSKTTSIDTSSFDTSNVEKMVAMFSGSSITDIDVSNFDTSSVTNMGGMFGFCSSLTSLDLSNFDVSKVTIFGDMFYNTPNLISLNLDNFDFSTSANGIFDGATSLKNISAKNWKIPSNFQHAFFRAMSGEGSIQEIDVTGWDLSNINDITGLFAISGPGSSRGLGLERIKGLETWETSHITNMSQMFQGLSSLTTLDLSSFNTSNVTNTDDMFKDCTSVTTAYGRTNSDITKFNASSNKPSNITFTLKN